MYNTLGDFIDTICNHYCNRDFIYFPTTHTTYTYSSFHNLVNVMCDKLINLDLKIGDSIAIISYNSPKCIALQWACFKLGIIAVCLNPEAAKSEIKNSINYTNVKIVITSNSSLKELNSNFHKILLFEELDLDNTSVSLSKISSIQSKVKSDNIALVLFTSGTTSSPKAVGMKHSSIISAMINFMFCVTYTQHDNALICTPFSHMLGSLYAILTVSAFGSKITLLEKFKTERVLKTIEKEKCSIFLGVPTMFLFLLDNIKNYDLSSLRTGLIAGSSVSKSLYKRIYNELGMTELLQAFGQTESLAITATTMKDNFDKRSGSCGKPLDNAKIKIVDINTQQELPNNEQGEILVYSDCLMDGYINNKDATSKAITKDGWIRTGDLGYLDNDGYLHVKSRIKDVIIRGGENICPSEIEEALMNIPEIKDVSVIGVPDEYKSEEICAFVVPSDDNHKIDIDFIKEQLSGIIAKYKIPKYVINVDSFPKNHTEKIAKNILKQLASEHLNQ